MPVSHPMRGARPHEARPWGEPPQAFPYGHPAEVFTGRVLRNTRTRADLRRSVRDCYPTRPRDHACDRRPPNSRASDARRCADAIPAPTRGPLPERKHRLGDLAGRRIADRSGSFLEDEQPCPGYLARDCLAVADGEERVAAAVDDERGDLDLGQALAPAGFAVELGEDHAELVGHLDWGCGAGCALP